MMQPDQGVTLTEPQAPARPTKVLTVEDNPGDVRLVKEKLAAQQIAIFKLVAVASLGEALARLAAEPFDAVMLDLSLPDAQGLEALQRIRQQKPRTPIVVLTGLSDSSLAIQAVREGAQDYLVKGEASGNALALCLRFAIERYSGLGVPWDSPDLPEPSQALGFIGCKGAPGHPPSPRNWQSCCRRTPANRCWRRISISKAGCWTS
jgi:CheY-like chemotaxis protein